MDSPLSDALMVLMCLMALFAFVGVGISIIGRPRPLPGHDTPNAAHNTYTPNYEESLMWNRVNLNM